MLVFSNCLAICFFLNYGFIDTSAEELFLFIKYIFIYFAPVRHSAIGKTVFQCYALCCFMFGTAFNNSVFVCACCRLQKRSGKLACVTLAPLGRRKDPSDFRTVLVIAVKNHISDEFFAAVADRIDKRWGSERPAFSRKASAALWE